MSETVFLFYACGRMMPLLPSLQRRVSKVYCDSLYDSVADGLNMEAVVTAMWVQTPHQ